MVTYIQRRFSPVARPGITPLGPVGSFLLLLLAALWPLGVASVLLGRANSLGSLCTLTNSYM